MGTGFDERLKIAMIAADVGGIEELARRCRVPESIVEGWRASNGESLSLRQAIALKRALNVRPQWLMDGGHSMLSVRELAAVREAIAVAEMLERDQREVWLRIGRNMALLK